MHYELFYERFSKTLYSIIPNRKELINYISETLHLDKRSASRRLHGEYQFRINEVLKLCSLLDISLDPMIFQGRSRYIPPTLVYYPFDNLTQKEYQSLYTGLNRYKAAAEDKNSYILLSSNILPEIFGFEHESLIRFFKLKWGYYMNNMALKNYMETPYALQPEHMKVIREYMTTTFKFEKLLIVWDYNIIPSIIKDIEYFTHIGYLTPEQREDLKKDLFLVIDKIDMLCTNWTNPQSTNNFTFAVSSTYLRKTHSIYKGNDFKIAVDSAFYTSYLYVKDPTIVESVEHIISATLKSSVIISQSNELERMKFIAEQKKLIEQI